MILVVRYGYVQNEIASLIYHLSFLIHVEIIWNAEATRPLVVDYWSNRTSTVRTVRVGTRIGTSNNSEAIAIYFLSTGTSSTGTGTGTVPYGYGTYSNQ